jgi:hypothetical protein
MLWDPNFSDEVAFQISKEFTCSFSKIRLPGKPFAIWRTGMMGQEEKWVEMIEAEAIPLRNYTLGK